MTPLSVDIDDVREARSLIRNEIRHTPLTPAGALSADTGLEVFLKLETLQETGSFKVRGATNRMLRLSPAERRRGVVTVSTGNHGRAVAHAAARLGIPAVVCMSTLVPGNKIQAIEALGAEIRIAGDNQDEAGHEAARLVEEQAMTLVPPFDDPHVIAGQGTIGLEIHEDLPEPDAIIVPLSGGGLIGGVAAATKALAPRARVIGVTMDRGAAMFESLKAGHPVEVEELPTLADSLGGGIGPDNRHTFRLVRELVDDVVLVSEAEIAAAMGYIFRTAGLVTEGAAAVGVAALMTGRISDLAGAVVVVLSGRNVDPDRFIEIVTRAGEVPVPSPRRDSG
ncbi:MAG: hydroxyectoine utilization dehydratase EutB [Alphaproteobacteria bacterium]